MSEFINIDGRTALIDDNLVSATNSLSEPKPNIDIDKKQIETTTIELNKSKDAAVLSVKKNEHNDARYKIIRKYAEVLKNISHLINLIPTDVENLSTTELEEKLQELLATRKKNNDQSHFIFYQNLISDLLTNLMNIEKDFNNGAITADEAYASVQNAKQQIQSYAKEIPPVLKPTIEEASFLVQQYEKGFGTILETNVSGDKTPLKVTELSATQVEMLTSLNGKTEDILKDISSITEDLSSFQPQVDLGALNTLLGPARELVESDNWTIDQMSVIVDGLDSSVNGLIGEQVDKNNQSYNIQRKIETCTQQTTSLSTSSANDFAVETFNNITERTEQNTEVLAEVQESVEESSLSDDIGNQFAETVYIQSEADEALVGEILADPKVDNLVYSKAPIDKERDASLDLKDIILSKQEEYILKLSQNRDDSEQPKT